LCGPVQFFHSLLDLLVLCVLWCLTRFWENEERREQPSMEAIIEAVTVVTYVSSGARYFMDDGGMSKRLRLFPSPSTHTLCIPLGLIPAMRCIACMMRLNVRRGAAFGVVGPDDESDATFDSPSSHENRMGSSNLHSLSLASAMPLSPSGAHFGSPLVRHHDQVVVSCSFIGVGTRTPLLQSLAGTAQAASTRSVPLTSERQSMTASGQRMALGPGEVFTSPKPRRTGVPTAEATPDAHLRSKASRRVRLLLARAFM
jgi:hypothetical protein